MANVIGVDHAKFKDRGYTWIQPTEQECKEMNWHFGRAPFVVDDANSVKRWLVDTIWWQDYAMFPYGHIYFKHERDLLMFKLKWC